MFNKMKSNWSFLQHVQPDPILGLTHAFNNDTFSKKVNLGVGAFRDNNGKPYLLESVKIAQIRQLHKNFEYVPIEGSETFIKATQQFIFNYNKDIIDRTTTVQTLSGTGSLRLCADFIRQNKDNLNEPVVYIPKHTWSNHKNILTHSNVKWTTYDYYDEKTRTIDWNNLIKQILCAKPKSIILLHACAHNPTGTDLSKEQWKELSYICKRKNHIVWFDSAYQGFASGDPIKDSYSYSIFIKDDHQLMLSQSYAKNMGLYGMRVGSLSFITKDEKEKKIVLDNLKSIIRPKYSSPPIEGAQIVSDIINDMSLNKLWHSEMLSMVNRIQNTRKLLQQKLESELSIYDWTHVTKQIGMFWYSGLSKNQIEKLINEYHIYLTSDGRISLSGMTNDNIDYVVDSIKKTIHLTTINHQ
jgi:aspartate aminotransferase